MYILHEIKSSKNSFVAQITAFHFIIVIRSCKTLLNFKLLLVFMNIIPDFFKMLTAQYCSLVSPDWLQMVPYIIKNPALGGVP